MEAALLGFEWCLFPGTHLLYEAHTVANTRWPKKSMCGEWLLVQCFWETRRSHCSEHSICPPGTALRTTFRLLCTASDEQTEAAGSALAGSPQPRGLAAAPGLLWQMKLAVRVLSQVWLYPLPVATF